MLRNIALKGFRNFKKKEFEFSDGVTVIVGDNATGKTNILEAICLLSTGKSFKARLEREIINYTSDIARIKGTTRSKSITGTMNVELEIVLTNGEIELHGGGIQKAQKKKLLVNGVNRRLIDFAGNLKVVLFGPWDMDLVTASPSLRRRFLDSVLAITDREYRRSEMLYEKGLRQRNRLLLRIRDESVSRGQLLYWDKLLIKHGQYLTEKREKFIEFINESKTSLLKSKFNGDFSLVYDRSEIGEGRLKQYEEAEIASGTTLVGPHRDDFSIVANYQMGNGRNLAAYGSRGEQRMGVLWIKFAELSYIESVTGEKPVLLLDDIFSELDHEHRDIVIESCSNQQTIITTADPHYIEGVEGEVIKI